MRGEEEKAGEGGREEQKQAGNPPRAEEGEEKGLGSLVNELSRSRGGGLRDKYPDAGERVRMPSH